MASLQTEELLRKLDEQHQAYIKTFRLIHEALAQNAQSGQNAQETSSTNALTFPIPSPTHLTIATPQSPSSRAPSRRRRRSTEVEVERPLRRPGTFHSSVFTGESDESDTDGDLYVQQPLPSYSFDIEDLRQHLKTYAFGEAGEILLKSVVKHGRLKYPGLFHDYPKEEKWHNSHYSVFDVDRDGAPVSRWEVVRPGTTTIDSAIWQVIQDLNNKPEARTASGRITIVREPSPLILGAIHLTMNRDFDMDEIFAHLVEEKRSDAHMANRAFEVDERKQRTFIFNFDYYTIVGEESQPMPWQRTDKPEKQKKKSGNHIHLSRCTSVVALSLSGGHVKKLRNAARRTKMRHGFVYDSWAPWQVLNIQCYPDHKHSMDSHDSTKHYVNGPEAFLHTLLAELKDAEKRFKDINIRITKLVTPEPEFIFSAPLRDALLFEDPSFTYSRRYFWAYQTLGILMNSIKDILDATSTTLTPEFWTGTHRSLFPMLEADSARNIYWRKRMSGLQVEFATQIKKLEAVWEENDERRKEIRTLRDQLFSGTSVLESRKSVELGEVTILQGHNIKLLTLVSIFFLPLTFVTSVFGMSNMPQEHEFTAFGIVMSTVCIPFFLLIGSLNTTQGMRFWRGKYVQVVRWVFDWGVFGGKGRKGKGRKGKGKGKKRGGWDGKDESESESSDDDDDDAVGVGTDARNRTRKRSLSTNIAMKKRQQQIKPLESVSTPPPAPPPLLPPATSTSNPNSNPRLSSSRVKIESGDTAAAADEGWERGRKPSIIPSQQIGLDLPKSELIGVEVLPGNDSLEFSEGRRVLQSRTWDDVQMTGSTEGKSEHLKDVGKEGKEGVNWGSGWWERIVGRRKRGLREGNEGVAV